MTTMRYKMRLFASVPTIQDDWSNLATNLMLTEGSQGWQIASITIVPKTAAVDQLLVTLQKPAED
jgi:hypothetical protein